MIKIVVSKMSYQESELMCTLIIVIIIILVISGFSGFTSIVILILVLCIIGVILIITTRIVYPSLKESNAIKKVKEKEAELASQIESQITPEEIFHCPYCGGKLIIGSPFCDHCGKNLRDISS